MANENQETEERTYTQKEVEELLRNHSELWQVGAKALSRYELARHLVEGKIPIDDDITNLKNAYDDLKEYWRGYIANANIPEEFKNIEKQERVWNGIEAILNNIKKNAPEIIKESRELRDFYSGSVLHKLGRHTLKHGPRYTESIYLEEDTFD